MALFLGVHTLQKDMGGRWTAYKRACEEFGCRAITSYSSSKKGVAYCVTEAPSAEKVFEAHRNANVPVDDVFEVDRSE